MTKTYILVLSKSLFGKIILIYIDCYVAQIFECTFNETVPGKKHPSLIRKFVNYERKDIIFWDNGKSLSLE